MWFLPLTHARTTRSSAFIWPRICLLYPNSGTLYCVRGRGFDGSKVEEVQVRTNFVCVADSDEATAKQLADGLTLNGYNVRIIKTPAQARIECRKGNAPVLVLDANFDDKKGISLARQLKADPKTAEGIILVALDKEARKRFSIEDALEVEDYLTKPYDLPILMIRIEAAMRKKFDGNCLENLNESLGDASYTDELTGLRNRRYLLERLQEEVEKAHRYNFPISCVVFDVDEVEALDDELGAVSLDDLLVELAMAMRNYSRTFDILARYDGSMFAAVLPHVGLEHAIQYAHKIISEVDNTTFADPSFPSRTQLSAGIVACRNGSARGAEAVLAEAMQSLLAAQGVNGRRVRARNLSEDA
jgi:two-component system, cell cycle response regulator